jgi:ubiquinone/menaquinone biosynthesis C-methylase UbiE/uncharacterized protein YbaR (Trm112 family)
MSKINIGDNEIVPQQIASTNGLHYVELVNNIKYYPRYNLPVPRARKNEIMLDIGAGWGRWLVAGADKGYIPVGIDFNLGFCQAVQKTLVAHRKRGYIICSDLQDLPFQDNVFDLVWSFSVLQHVHQKKLISSLQHMNRILAPGGFTWLEFPNKYGLRNRIGPAMAQNDDNFDSMQVRYYSIEEYRKMFLDVFKNFRFKSHSFFGIGVLPEDLKYVSWKKKPLVAISLFFSGLSKLIPGMKNWSDSIYLISKKKNQDQQIDYRAPFLKAHSQNDNLSIVHLLRCPFTGGSITITNDRKYLLSEKAGKKFPIIDDIPVLLKHKAIAL